MLPPPIWVDQQKSYELMVEQLSLEARIAVDTESNSLHAYRERVCLVQFSTPEKDYVVDPLVLQDLDSLRPIFCNPNIEKIFHAAEYDLICLRRDYDFTFTNLFDTMQAARILGYTQVGLDNLLAEKFGVRMDKRHQKADWGARPLTLAQIDYARFDTRYLFQLRDLLEQELREKGRWDLAQEDFALASHVGEAKERNGNGASWKRFASRKDLSPRELTVVSELCVCRDRIAERLDRPVFKVIGDDMLLDIARKLPEKDVDLAGIGLSAKQIKLWGPEILESTRRGMEAPLVKREPSKRPSDAVLRRLDKLKNWRKKRARELSVESDVILPKMYLAMLSENPPSSLKELEIAMHRSPTRFHKYGAEIYHLIGA
ncbi:MAG TPA: ribonuclease D [Anaerolineales bacterium]|nr:ribonuclease D [Anaerolineales bacterium]